MKMTSVVDSSQIEQQAANEPNGKSKTVASATSSLTSPSASGWTKVHWALLAVALVVLVVAGQGQHFFYDEWAFIGGKLDALPLSDRYLLPHNEHWSMLPVLAYQALGATVGVGSYWPYLGLLLLLHLGVTHVLWRLMLVTGSKPFVATALAAVFSVLGAGAEDLVWAFQIGFVGSTLLGVSAIYLAVTGTARWRKTGILGCLTMAGLATSGVGLAYLIVVPLVYAWRQRRHAVVVFCLPLLVYITWYAMYGLSLTHAPPASATAPVMISAFVLVGLVAALTRFLGFGNNMASFLAVGTPVLAALMLACRGWRADRTLVGRALWAMFAGAVVFFGTVGVARAGLGLGYATVSRYIYVAIALLLPAIALVISRGTAQHPRLMRAVLPLALAMAASNTFQLLTFATEIRQENNASRRVLMAASDLVRSNSPIFANQLPEPHLAADLTIADLRSRHLDAAFEDISPKPSDRLTASLNLQIRVALDRGAGKGSPCRTAPEQRITIATSRDTNPPFVVTGEGPVDFTLYNAGSRSAQREIVLTKGTYKISSVRDAGALTIESTSPSSLLAHC